MTRQADTEKLIIPNLTNVSNCISAGDNVGVKIEILTSYEINHK